MLIELITPLMLATAPMAITVEDKISYSHETQSVVAFNNGGTNYGLGTISGTRTYSGNGTPNDSDND